MRKGLESLFTHIGCFRNTVFSLQTLGGYAINLQQIYINVNRQSSTLWFKSVCQTSAMLCLFSIGLLLWLFGLAPATLLRHMQFPGLTEQAVQQSLFARWWEGETRRAMPRVRLNTGSIKTAENKMYSGLYFILKVCASFPSDT